MPTSQIIPGRNETKENLSIKTSISYSFLKEIFIIQKGYHLFALWTGFYMVGTPRHEKVNRIFSSEAVSWRCSIKIGVLENFAKLTRKHNSLEHTCTDKINLWQFSSAIKIMIQFLEITMTLEREASLKYVLPKSYSEKNDALFE